MYLHDLKFTDEEIAKMIEEIDDFNMESILKSKFFRPIIAAFWCIANKKHDYYWGEQRKKDIRELEKCKNDLYSAKEKLKKLELENENLKKENSLLKSLEHVKGISEFINDAIEKTRSNIYSYMRENYETRRDS